MSTCISMTAISVIDNLKMLAKLHFFLVSSVKMLNPHLIECQLLAYFHLLAVQNSTLQVISMTVDKYIAIKWPHKAPIKCYIVGLCLNC